MRNVVIALTRRDFEDWCLNQKRSPRDPELVCVTRADHVLGMSINRIYCTERAWENPNYIKLLQIAEMRVRGGLSTIKTEE